MKEEAKTILVTGGLGSIGHVLCRYLIDGGYEVVVVDDLSVGRKEFLEELPEAKFYKCDVADYGGLEKVFEENGINAVVHLAAKHYIPYCEEHHKETMETNVFGTYNILLLAKKFGVGQLVFPSTSSIYKPLTRPYREDDEVGPINIYGASKLMCENAIKIYAPLNGFSYTILRFYNVYGPDDLVHHVIPELVKQARESNRVEVGNLDSKRDFIKSKDISSAIIKSLEKDIAKNNVYNVGAGRALSVREVCDELKRVSGKDLEFEVADNKKRENDPPLLLGDISKITRELDWHPDEEFSLKDVFEKTRFWPES